MFSNSRFQTHIGSLIYKSTNSDMLVGVDWDLFLKIVDSINNACKINDHRILDNVVDCLDKRLRSNNADDLEYTLKLLHTIVLNTDARMVHKIANEIFLQTVYKVTKNKTVRVSHTALNLLRDWGEVFPRSGSFAAFPHFYHTLRSNGVTFPPRESRAGTEEAIQKLRSEYTCLKSVPATQNSSAAHSTGSTSYPIPIGLQNSFSSGSAKFDQTMHAIIHKARSLLQMIYQTPCGVATRTSAVLQELAGELLQIQTQVQTVIQNASNGNLAEHIVVQLFSLNDALNEVLQLFETRSKTPPPSPKPIPPKPSSQSSSKDQNKNGNQNLPGAGRRASHDQILKRRDSGIKKPLSFSLLGAPPGSKHKQKIAPKPKPNPSPPLSQNQPSPASSASHGFDFLDFSGGNTGTTQDQKCGCIL